MESPDILNELGLCYVHFFLVNPYYSVLFSDCIHAESAIWKDTGKSNPAFKVLEETASKTLADLNLPKEERHNLILAMWTLVHGMAVIVSMPNVSERLKKEGNVKEKLRRILTAFR